MLIARIDDERGGITAEDRAAIAEVLTSSGMPWNVESARIDLAARRERGPVRLRVSSMPALCSGLTRDVDAIHTTRSPR
jgi:hypothetical protein